MPFSRGRAALILFALLRFGVCWHRARTQSIVHDEAFSYDRFIAGPWSSIYSTYDANNHVLYSILAKLSVGILGLSEFSLRLPSVLAGFALLLGLWQILQKISSPQVRWVAIAAFGVHPLLLDFSVAARGYGLSLALFVWAICGVFSEMYWMTGILLGLAVAANLSSAFPALALLVAAALTADDSIRKRLRHAFEIGLPAAVTFGLICYLPLSTATRNHFYFGETTLHLSLFSLIHNSIRTRLTFPGLIGTELAATVIEVIFLPALCLSALWVFRRRANRDRDHFLPVATLIVAVLGLVAAHVLLDVKYPADRTGLWMILLFGLAWASAADVTSWRSIRAGHGIFAGLLILQFLTQFETKSLIVWTYDKDTRRVAQMLQRESSGFPQGSVSVSASLAHQPALEFYRKHLALAALKPVIRQDWAPLSGHDYYVLNYPEIQDPELKTLRVLFYDPVSGIVLAARSRGAH